MSRSTWFRMNSISTDAPRHQIYNIYTLDQNGGNIFAFFGGWREDSDLLLCYVVHAWIVKVQFFIV